MGYDTGIRARNIGNGTANIVRQTEAVTVVVQSGTMGESGLQRGGNTQDSAHHRYYF